MSVVVSVTHVVVATDIDVRICNMLAALGAYVRIGVKC